VWWKNIFTTHLIKNKINMKNIMMIIGITAWIFFFIAIYNNAIDYAILFALFAHIFHSESNYYDKI
jgi:hypothetical protein